jgi:peroxiredoxin
MGYPKLFRVAALLILLAGPVVGSASASECVGHIKLPAAQGGSYDVCDGSGKPMLLAFLHVVPDRADTPSRSQAVFLSSMYEQYGARGLEVLAVETTASSRRQLVNAVYDWQLAFPLLEDERSQAKKAFEVTVVPSSFLLDPDGKVLERWDGLASSAALARAIEVLLGGPLGRLPRASPFPYRTP